MQKTINHTGRRKILRSELQIRLTEHDQAAPEFDVDFSLNRDNLPDDATVYIEAYKSNTNQRFHFGTVDHIVKPENRKLDKLDLTAPTLFRIRIVDESGKHGRLIASADQIRPESDEEAQKSSLLPVKSTPLDQLTWKLEIEAGSKPVLCINNRIPDPVGQISNNPRFQSLILPAVLRQILMFYLWNADDDNEDDPVTGQWLRFAEHIHMEKPHEDDPLMLMQWIDEVVSEFSRAFKMTDILLLKMEEDAS